MNPQLQKLVAIQQIDTEIDEIQGTLALIPKQIDAGARELESKKGKLNALQAEIESLRKQRKKYEQDVQVENDHIAKTKSKLPTVKTNKEYSAILAEIDSIKKKIESIEEKELEVMEALEEKEKEIPGLQEEFRGEEQKFNEYKKKKEEELSRTRKELERLQARQRELMEAVDPKLAALYKKIAGVRGNAVVHIEGEVCQGCHQHIQPQVALEVRNSPDKIHHCQFCDRFLYAIPKPEEETETQTAVSK